MKQPIPSMEDQFKLMLCRLGFEIGFDLAWAKRQVGAERERPDNYRAEAVKKVALARQIRLTPHTGRLLSASIQRGLELGGK